MSRRAALRAGAASTLSAAAGVALACGARDRQVPRAQDRDRSTGSAQAATQPDAPRYGGIISQRLATDPPSLDLHQVTTYTGVWPTAPCFNQLVQFDPGKPSNAPDEIITDLAERWEQPDAATVVFSLKQGVKFHDGTDLTAEDVKVQLDWIRKPPEGKTSPRQAALGTIAAIETAGPGTVVLKLTRPTPSLLMNLASHYLAIGQARDIIAHGEVGPQLIGTGPFRLKTYQRSNILELDRNPAYHVSGRPYLDGLRFFILSDLTAAIGNFAEGQYDLFYDNGFRPSHVSQLRSELGSKLDAESVPSTLRAVVFMNARRKPYDDVRVRQAISLALDRDAVIKTVKEGAARRGGYMAPDGVWGLPAGELRRYDGYDRPDPDRSRQLLTEAGVGALIASSTTRTDFRGYGEFLKDALTGIGIDLTLNIADTAVSQPLLQRGEFDIAPWLVAIHVDDPDATFSEIATSTAVRNWSGIKDPQVDALFEKQSQTIEFAARKKIVNDLERQALAQYQVAVLLFEDLTFAKFAKVRNFVFHSSLYTNRRMESVWLAG